MKTPIVLIISLLLSLISCIEKASESSENEISVEHQFEYYQLKTYTFDTEEQVLTTEKYLEQAFLPGLKKLGIKNIGVFKPRPSENDTLRMIFVLIPFSSLNQFQSIEAGLTEDENYLAGGAEYLNAAYDNPPYRRIETTLLQAFEDMPFMKIPALEGPRSKRVYELRSYESATEDYHNKKVDMFNAGGEINLFASLEFNAVFYAKVISGSKMPNLMYMTTFSDEESQQTHWDAFRNSPQWMELKEVSKYKNTVSHIDRYLLYPTEYSDY